MLDMGYISCSGEKFEVDEYNEIIENNFWFLISRKNRNGEIIRRNNVTAVACSADIIAIGIIKRYKEIGKNVPDDLSIVGFDDIQDSKYIYPGLTTIHQDIGVKGEKAMNIILDSLRKNSHNKILINLKPYLVERESVKEVI